MSDQQITFPKKYKYLSPRYIPNYLTILRMVLVPIIIILLLNNNHKVVYQYKFFDETYTFYSNYFIAGILFIIACLTDYLDGYLARKNNWISNFGKIWDPIADKVLVNSVCICMTFLHIIPAWLVIIFILRDTVVDAYRMSAIKKNINVAANMLGKLKTTFQMIGLIIIFFVWNSTTIYEHSPLHYYIAQNFVMMVACCFSIASGIVYIYKFSTYKNV